MILICAFIWQVSAVCVIIRLCSDWQVPREVSITTSTFLKIPRRSSFCRASWDFRITCTTNKIIRWCQWRLLTSIDQYSSINMHPHQSSSLPGKLLRFHKSTGPPWFFQARLCALVGLWPVKKKRRGTLRKLTTNNSIFILQRKKTLISQILWCSSKMSTKQHLALQAVF